MRVPVTFALIAVAVFAGFGRPAAADLASVIDVTFGAFSLPAPTSDGLVVCHGFGCKFRNEVTLTAGDRATLARLLSAGKASAAQERRAIAAAGAWFDRRIAVDAGTVGHQARAGYHQMY